MFSLFLFICITVFLLMRLNDILGIHMGFKVHVEDDQTFSENSSVEEIRHDENRTTANNSSDNYAGFVPHDFLEKSKKAFEVIFEAYAKGDKRILKELLAPKLYNAFCMAIDDRNSRGETLEGILVRFMNAEVIDSSVNDDDAFITVKFVTEQSNVLKDRNGTVLEGDSDFVDKRIDTWVFARKRSSMSATWLLYEIING